MALKARQKLGKYRIERRISEGPIAAVYEAVDTIHGLNVALKIPHESSMSEHFLADFKREARLAHRLEHPNILPIRDASFIADRFVIAMPLGERSLSSRMRRRFSTESSLQLIEQALAALAHAHRANVIHCDIKPANFILFPNNQLKLTDFGFSKVAERTLKASGSGTVGYIAPEQAVGRPKFQSDVFSLGLLIYELLSGYLPEWPYTWPPPEIKRVREKIGPKLADWLRRAIEVRPEKRFKNAATMYREFKRLRNGAGKKQPPRARQQGGRSVAVAEGAVPPVPTQIRQADRGPLSVPPLRGTGVGAHAVLPVVRHGAAARSAPEPPPCRVSALPPRREDRLALLPVVLRAGFRGRDDAALLGQALQHPLP